jgi:hypothetical protein
MTRLWRFSPAAVCLCTSLLTTAVVSSPTAAPLGGKRRHAAVKAHLRKLTPYGSLPNRYKVGSAAARSKLRGVGSRPQARMNGARRGPRAAAAGVPDPAAQPSAAPGALAEELRLLEAGHSAALGVLPTDIQDLDRRAAPVASRLPELARLSYLRSVQHYPDLKPGQQTVLRSVMERMAALEPAQQEQFLQGVSQRYEQVTPRQAKARPYQAPALLREVLDRLRQQ